MWQKYKFYNIILQAMEIDFLHKINNPVSNMTEKKNRKFEMRNFQENPIKV